MKYYKSNDKLIRYNEQTDKWFWCNKFGDKLINKPNDLIVLKKDKFNQLLNEWYRNQNHEWEYNGVVYQKAECLKKVYNHTKDEFDLPIHLLTYGEKAHIVLQQGYLYYAYDYHYYPKLVLFDFETKKWCKWANINNCYAIINKQTGMYI